MIIVQTKTADDGHQVVLLLAEYGALDIDEGAI